MPQTAKDIDKMRDDYLDDIPNSEEEDPIAENTRLSEALVEIQEATGLTDQDEALKTINDIVERTLIGGYYGV